MNPAPRPHAAKAQHPNIAQEYGLTTDLIRRGLRGLGVRQVASSAYTPQGFLPVRVERSRPPPAVLHIEVHRGGTLRAHWPGVH